MKKKLFFLYCFFLMAGSTNAQIFPPALPLMFQYIKYDIDIELNHFTVSNVRDLDGTEDLWGRMFFKSLAIDDGIISIKNFDPPRTGLLWDKPAMAANTNSYRNGTYHVGIWYRDVNNGEPLFRNLRLDQLRHIQLKIGGLLADNEGLFGPIFKCASCSEQLFDIGYRTIKFIEMDAVQTSITNLQITGFYQVLQGDTNEYFELRFFENGVKQNGYVRTMWKVWIKPHF